MPDWLRIADDAVEATFGPAARVHLARPAGRCVVYVDGQRQILAIAGGANSASACRALIQQCYRDDHRPTTSEVAAVLGISAAGVRQRVFTGTLIPEGLGSGPREARFNAEDVWALVKEVSTKQRELED